MDRSLSAVWMCTYPVCLYNSPDGMHTCASTTIRTTCTHAIEVRVAGIFVIISLLSMREIVDNELTSDRRAAHSSCNGAVSL